MAEQPDFDPSLAAIRPPYTAAFNDLVRRGLGFDSDVPYHILGGGIGQWDWGSVYTLDHLGLPASLRSRITQRYYQAGHMMYIDADELAALRRDVAAFIAEALK